MVSHETAVALLFQSTSPSPRSVDATRTEIWSRLLLSRRLWGAEPEGSQSASCTDCVTGRGARPRSFSLGHASVLKDHGLQVQVERPGLRGCEGVDARAGGRLLLAALMGCWSAPWAASCRASGPILKGQHAALSREPAETQYTACQQGTSPPGVSPPVLPKRKNRLI